MPTKDQIKAGIETIKAVSDAIKELKEVPSGHLYAHVMNQITLDQYNKIIDILKKGEVIREKNNLLIWNIDQNN